MQCTTEFDGSNLPAVLTNHIRVGFVCVRINSSTPTPFLRLKLLIGLLTIKSARNRKSRSGYLLSRHLLATTKVLRNWKLAQKAKSMEKLLQFILMVTWCFVKEFHSKPKKSQPHAGARGNTAIPTATPLQWHNLIRPSFYFFFKLDDFGLCSKSSTSSSRCICDTCITEE